MTSALHLDTPLHRITPEPFCCQCQGKDFCLSVGLQERDKEDFRAIVTKQDHYAACDLIYGQQSRFQSLYLIHSGAVKTETVTESGRHAVIEFYQQGDLFGIDAIGSVGYPNNAVALEETRLCEISYSGLLGLCSQVPELQQRLIVFLGTKLRYWEYVAKVVRNESAEHRVMYFLHKLFERQTDGNQGNQVYMPMSKQDAASYLGLTPETFSRTLTHLQNEGYIQKESKRVLVLLKLPRSKELQYSMMSTGVLGCSDLLSDIGF